MSLHEHHIKTEKMAREHISFMQMDAHHTEVHTCI